jgi:hypothetical protein
MRQDSAVADGHTGLVRLTLAGLGTTRFFQELATGAEAPERTNVPHPGGPMSLSIQYAGFHVQPHGRDYAFYVLDPPAASRHFIVTITHQAFAERRILYQDAADLCYQKLQQEIRAETEEWPLGSHCIISDQELAAYRATHRPPKHRSW